MLIFLTHFFIDNILFEFEKLEQLDRKIILNIDFVETIKKLDKVFSFGQYERYKIIGSVREGGLSAGFINAASGKSFPTIDFDIGIS